MSLEKTNLLAEGPQRTAMFSPAEQVLKITDECLDIRSRMNFSGHETNAHVWPSIGHPVHPGGRLLELRVLGFREISVRMTRIMTITRTSENCMEAISE